jgi:hypothetical protein
MPRFADHLTGIADILHSSADGGEVRVNYGEETTGEGHLSDVQTWGPDGYIARPNDPSDKGATQVLYIVDGQQQRAIAYRGNYFAAQAGTLEPGDRMIVTDGPSRIYMKRASQRVGMYTEAVSTPPAGGKGMLIEADGEAGVLRLRAGGAVVELDGNNGTITLTAAGLTGKAVLVLSPTEGAQILAGAIHLDTLGFVTLGLNSSQTRPGIPGVDTVTIGASGQTAIAAPRVSAAQF